jgi:hypothetical protein
MRRTFPLLLLVAAAAVAASSAPATIVPQTGIAGVNLGMKQAKVRSVLGRPTTVKHGSNDFGKYTIYRYAALQVMFQGNTTVTAVSTSRTGERTAGGVGPGSTEARLKAKLKGLTCKTESGFRHCYLGKFLVGHRVTDFSIVRDKVTLVEIGFVVD